MKGICRTSTCLTLSKKFVGVSRREAFAFSGAEAVNTVIEVTVDIVL